MAKTLFLGVEGAGKTTLAMAMTKAFAQHAGEGWYLRPVDRGAYNFATIAMSDFGKDGFPRQTANVREMVWKIEQEGRELGELEILDYPGEVYRLAFMDAEEVSESAELRVRQASNEQEISTLRHAIESAERVFVLFNLQDALDLRNNDANRGAVWVTNESLKFVKALPSKPSVTLVFTQVDRYQTADDFLHSFRPTELPLVGHDHPDVDWTMVSVMVPPESEFGVDAFVRRCTGLRDFGVPTGRPVDKTAVAAATGDALKRLAESRQQEESAPAPQSEPVEAPTSSPAEPEAPREEPSKSQAKTPTSLSPSLLKPLTKAGPVIWVGVLLTIVTLVSVLTLAMMFSRSQRTMERMRGELESRQNAQLAVLAASVSNNNAAVTAAQSVKDGAPVPAQAAKTASSAVETSKVETPKDETPKEPEVAPAKKSVDLSDPQVENPPPEREQLAPEEVERRKMRKAQNEATARRIASAAWDAWQNTEVERKQRKVQLRQAYEAALKLATPQAAHETLCDAAEADIPEAQYRLACVYDIWGWGGWVRTREEASGSWTNWLRRIDFDKGAKAVAVSRAAPNAAEFQKLALDWYRAAAKQGVNAAAEALKLHEERK